MYPKLAIVAAVLLCATGCRTKSEPVATSPNASAETPTPSNRIDIPPSVRSSLGITFVEAEARVVASTIRAPGQFEAQQSASRTIMLFSGLVALVMLLLLHVAIGSLRVALLVMVNLPLALIGGVVAIFVTESPDVLRNLMGLVGGARFTPPVISIASLVGFITLFGIAVRNGILLVNHYRHLIEQEGAPLEEAILRGSQERLVPILMTALTAALALVPIALKGDQPGNEILAPLSVVVLGGLLTSTFLNLVVVPAGYAEIYRRGRRPKELRESLQTETNTEE